MISLLYRARSSLSNWLGSWKTAVGGSVVNGNKFLRICARIEVHRKAIGLGSCHPRQGVANQSRSHRLFCTVVPVLSTLHKSTETPIYLHQTGTKPGKAGIVADEIKSVAIGVPVSGPLMLWGTKALQRSPLGGASKFDRENRWEKVPLENIGKFACLGCPAVGLKPNLEELPEQRVLSKLQRRTLGRSLPILVLVCVLMKRARLLRPLPEITSHCKVIDAVGLIAHSVAKA